MNHCFGRTQYVYVWKEHDFVCIGKDLVLEEPRLKIEDKRFQVYVHIIYRWLWLYRGPGSTKITLLHQTINPKKWQVLSLGDAGVLQLFKVVSGDFGKPRIFIKWAFWLKKSTITWASRGAWESSKGLGHADPARDYRRYVGRRIRVGNSPFQAELKAENGEVQWIIKRSMDVTLQSSFYWLVFVFCSTPLKLNSCQSKLALIFSSDPWNITFSCAASQVVGIYLLNSHAHTFVCKSNSVQAHACAPPEGLSVDA